MNGSKLDPIFTEWSDDNPTGRTTQRAPELQPMFLGPSEGIEPLREDIYRPRMLINSPHDHGRVNYAAIERRIAKSLGPCAPKRKRRKRLAKKLEQRGGMLKTRGLVQSYFDAWPAMRMWFQR